MKDRDRLALFLILLLGTALRLFHVGAPFLDSHAWRQLDTAAMARNFYEDGFLPFDPQVDWGGRRGYLEAEFPLVPAIVAVVYRIGGLHDVLGRLTIIASGVALIWAVYRLALAVDGRLSVARAAAFLVAVSPMAVFFGRVVIPDTPMMLALVIALVGYIEYAFNRSSKWLTIGAISLTVACLLKLPAVFLGPAIVTALVQARGWSAFRDRRVWIAGVVPLAITAAWYWHAHVIFENTGLTMGILGAPTKFYPASVSPGPWPSIYSKWSTSALLADPEFYRRMFMRFYHLLLAPAGFVGALAGAVIWKGRGRLIVAVWLVSNVAFFLIAGEVHRVHEYYQLPFVVIGAIYFGAIAWPLFDGVWLRAQVGTGTGLRPVVLSGAALTIAGIASFDASGVTESHFSPRPMAEKMRQAGSALDQAFADNDLAVVVDDYGIMSPILLYFAHLKGWSFDPPDVTPQVIDNLRRLGARYFVTTQWSNFSRVRPDTADFLQRFEELPIPGAPADTSVRDLRRVR